MAKFKKGYVLSTGAVVRVFETPKIGVYVHFVNPLITPQDLPCATETDDESGRHTMLRLSDEAAINLMVLLQEWAKSRDAED